MPGGTARRAILLFSEKVKNIQTPQQIFAWWGLDAAPSARPRPLTLSRKLGYRGPRHLYGRRVKPMTETDLFLRLERDVPISPEACFEGWTVPERLMQWFCPRPWRVTACAINLHPGGAFATTMRSPEGVEMPTSAGCYLVVDAPHRLVWTNLLGPGFKPVAIEPPGFGFVCELRFDRLSEGSTRYQATVHHVDAAGRDAHAAMGFEAGWSAALDQLVALMQESR